MNFCYQLTEIFLVQSDSEKLASNQVLLKSLPVLRLPLQKAIFQQPMSDSENIENLWDDWNLQSQVEAVMHSVTKILIKAHLCLFSVAKKHNQKRSHVPVAESRHRYFCTTRHYSTAIHNQAAYSLHANFQHCKPLLSCNRNGLECFSKFPATKLNTLS